ncbi:MAG: preprotein translocase subunit YajC [Alphaproteobacteria bacterium]|nr:preprotein translocase subunit YajC [Alphaproteobacteria bacterium]
MFISDAFAQAPGGGAGGLEIFAQLVPFVLIFVIFYFLLIRPQQQRMKQHREMIAKLRRGDVVVTGGGLVGKVRTVSEGDDEVTIEIAKGVEVKVIRGTISEVRAKPEPISGKPPVKENGGDSTSA